MNNFFNLRLIKYPLSLLIIGLGVAIYLKVFPPKQDEQSSDFGKGAINLKLANSDTTIKEKEVFQEQTNTHNQGNPNTYLGGASSQEDDKARQLEIIQENKAANFRRRTYTPTYENRNTYLRKPPVNQVYASVSNETKSKATTDNVTIGILRKRLQQVEGKSKVDSLRNSKNEASEQNQTRGKKYDKNGFLILDVPVPEMTASLPRIDNNNRFYTNGKNEGFASVHQVPVMASKRSNQYQLLKARLVEDKTVRDNSSIKLMVTEPTIVNGSPIEKGQIILGKCVINADRLIITINGYIKENDFYPLEGRVLDIDGGDGLSINAPFDTKQSKRAWGQNASSALGSVNPLLVYQPTGNIGTTVTNQVVGSLVNQSLNGANQFLNAKINDVKANIKTGQLLYIQIKMN
ncbi:conjugative transposon protein TraM [Arcicella sp. LKC2W]|uniref:conjugative transposon protein TraM n=1 Tax=Arcicella sp. LKC2W TaxID=2984198 RepID=UPI002B21C9EB|nr:conjugative transposon protein TraM [Arcicella sp. LKC2W]MEA5458735.1 conjugative transposon protein TraM [Arcicella sp. LKC2W]